MKVVSLFTGAGGLDLGLHEVSDLNFVDLRPGWSKEVIPI